MNIFRLIGELTHPFSTVRPYAHERACLQETCRISRQYSSCFTKFKQRAHVEVRFQCFVPGFQDVLMAPPGLSFKTQLLYAVVFVARYLDLLWSWVSLYNFVMKLFFIGSSCYILYLMKVKFRCASFHYPVPRRMVTDCLLSDPPMILPLTRSKSNTSLGPAFFLASSSTTSSGSLRFCGLSPSSSSPLLFSHSYSCCKEQERRNLLQRTTLPLWERTGLSIFQTGYTGECGGRSLWAMLILTSFIVPGL